MKGLSFSIIDQGFFSGTNFLVNIFLARVLVESDYGQFSYLSSFHFLFLSISIALVMDPMAILSYRYEENQANYYTSILCIEVCIMVLQSIFYFVVASSLGFVFSLYSAVGTVVILLRRSCYINDRVPLAAIASLMFFIVTSIGYLFFHSIFEGINSWMLLLIFSLSPSLLALLIWSKLKLGSLDGSIIRYHLRLGSWLFVSAILGWIIKSLFIPILYTTDSLESAATFKAFDNIFLPVHQIITVFGIYYIPRLARRVNESPFREVETSLLKILMRLSTLILVICVGILVFSDQIFELIYDSKYLPNQEFLLLLSATVFFRLLIDFWFKTIFQITEHQKYILLTSAFGSLCTVTLGLFLIKEFSIQGAFWGYLSSLIVQALVSVFVYRHLRSKITIA